MNPSNPIIPPSMPANEPPKPSKPVKETEDVNKAADLIRQKIEALYREEPNAKDETKVATEAGRHRSKHQEFMHELSTSGKSLAEIQTDWHNYYVALPNNEKHKVWQEFYNSQSQASNTLLAPKPQAAEQPQPQAPREHFPRSYKAKYRTRSDLRSAQEIKQAIVQKLSSGGQLKAKHHLQSLLFGLGIGSLVLVVLLFGFFNERVVAPFMTPSRQVSSTPLIIDTADTKVGPEPKIIIPKINLEIPVDYSQESINEKDVQKALETGILHYPTTVEPGQKGNAAFFGHSSNNIFNKGKYKFAFVLLKRLEPGDLFYLHKDGVRYVYRVYEKQIVKPTDLWVLGQRDRPATATLITCDPPGTAINRLVVVGEQITPDPSGNTADTNTVPTGEPEILPSNAPSLWQRIVDILPG